jgi:cephalosporin hydroxylase
VARVRERISPSDRVLVFLDSNHTYDHVRAELDAYAPLVTPGSYIVSTDGVMREVADVPRGQAGWVTDNPSRAAEDFAREHPEFVLETPSWPFNESPLERGVTHWPHAWLKRRES